MVRPGGGGKYVLKFISGKYQGGEFPLEPNHEVIVGRASDVEMVLVEDMVSRQHARFTTTLSEVWIEDLGSTNGTFVNGEKITKVKLKDGDRILIGTSIVKLSVADQAPAEAPPPLFGAPRHSGGEQQTVMERLSQVTAPPMPQGRSPATQAVSPLRPNPMAAPAAPAQAPAGVLSGLIDQLPLPDLLQLFGNAKKSGCLIVNSKGSEGRVYMREGRVYAAIIDEQTDVAADKAFYRMMGWTTGSFLLDHTASRSFPTEINESIESLMMEGMRILDEIRNIGGDVPDYQAVLRIPAPIVPPLRNLSPELLDTLQLVHNYGRVETVLNKSLATDLETLQDIVYLLRNQYLAEE
ncbi:MAG: DUF4388 domain-containing protein [Myxococcota bacterium]|jgi:hypothetical protein|nr:DUF4388 domain-containing protein [Myxococcota bacterium]